MVFTDDYETICTQRTRYCESGSIATPSHRRGKRALIPNGRYITSEQGLSEGGIGGGVINPQLFFN